MDITIASVFTLIYQSIGELGCCWVRVFYSLLLQEVLSLHSLPVAPSVKVTELSCFFPIVLLLPRSLNVLQKSSKKVRKVGPQDANIIISYFKLGISNWFSKERCPILKQYSFYFNSKSVVGLCNIIEFLTLNPGRRHVGTGHKNWGIDNSEL